MACNLKKPACCTVLTFLLSFWLALWIFTMHSIYNTDYEGCATYMIWLFGYAQVLSSLRFWENSFKACNVDRYYKWFRRLLYESMPLIGICIFAMLLCNSTGILSYTTGFILVVQIFGIVSLGYACYRNKEHKYTIGFNKEEKKKDVEVAFLKQRSVDGV